MSWIQKLLDSYCTHFKACRTSNNTLKIGNYTVKVVDQVDLYTIQITSLNQCTPTIKIEDMFYDELEENLKKTLNSIQ
jgi:hypothetical protein